MTPVTSSALTHVHHDAAAQVLTVQMHGGKRYRYAAVSKLEFDELMAAPSIGRHFATVIKPGRRVSPA
jgi:hypothetical protein